MTIKLDLRTDLAKVTPDTVAEQGRACTYTAPCAIGAMMTVEQRNSVDDTAPIRNLVDLGVVDIPTAQYDDFRALQRAFDNDYPSFWTFVDELKEKYA